MGALANSGASTERNNLKLDRCPDREATIDYEARTTFLREVEETPSEVSISVLPATRLDTCMSAEKDK